MEGVLFLLHTLIYKNSEFYYMALVLKLSPADHSSIVSIKIT
jgi:hypothetical protein